MSGNDLVAVDLVANPTLRAGPPRRLFGGDAVGMKLTGGNIVWRFYTVSPDGRRFVVVKGHDTGNSDVVLAEGAITRVAPEGRS